MTLASRVKEHLKAFYRYTKKKRLTREKVGPLKDKGGNLYLEAKDVGEILNEYFAVIFTQEKDMEDSESCVEHANMLGRFEIKKEVVLDLLKNNKVVRFPGPDDTYPRLLGEAREEIAGGLTKIFVCLLVTGEVLENWRAANDVPLFKKGNKDHLGSYRPVRLTSVFGKLLERILRDGICAHLEKHGLIRDNQHGFVQGGSCLSNLIEFFEELTKVIDESRAVDVVYMDFSKAFDKVPHGRVIQKMHVIYADLATWIQNWFAIEES
eukprot:g42500.t1